MAIIQGTLNNDSIVGTTDSDQINADAGNDYVNGGGGYDTLQGGAGNDLINGHGLFEGGTGDDTLTGNDYGTVGDTYVFNLGDGKDTIFDCGASYGAQATDVLKFGAGISATDVTLQRVGNNMVFKINSSDQVTVDSWFLSGDRKLESIEFADGTVWTASSFTGMTLFINGTDGKDSLNNYGSEWSGTYSIDAGAGDDSITCMSLANNTLRGGAGNDMIYGHGWIEGGTGDDNLVGSSTGLEGETYMFNLGDGKDTITDYGTYIPGSAAQATDILKFGTGISAPQITLERMGYSMVFKVSATDQITVNSWFDTADRDIESIQFADGTIWDSTALSTLTLALNGTSGNDNITGWAYEWSGHYSINGGAGNDNITGSGRLDTLQGGAGNDSISGHGLFEGGTGNDAFYGNNTSTLEGDTYVFNLGDGKDYIWDVPTYIPGSSAQATDVLKFGVGISASQVTLTRSGNDLVLGISATDQVTIGYWFSSSGSGNNPIESIQFADGTIWDSTALSTLTLALNGTSGNDNITGWAYEWSGHYSINGGAGNDNITGSGRLDTLQGGAGNDSISGHGLFEGGTGNDAFYGNNTSTLEGDTYVFNLGDGKDYIWDVPTYIPGSSAQATDVLKFGVGISASQVTLTRSGNDLVLGISATDQVTVSYWFSSSGSGNNPIESIQFADGTIWDSTALSTLTLALNGTSGNDNITGWAYEWSGHYSINGGAGNDNITGSGRLDTLQGGAGNDSISGHGLFEGGTGNDAFYGNNTSTLEGDTYVFNLGDGKDYIWDVPTYIPGSSAQATDVLKFGVGISASQVTLTRSGNDLVLGISATDQVTIGYWFSSTDRTIESIQFADGSSWTSSSINSQILGTSGNDVLSGTNGADTINGGGGQDTLAGNAGNDSLLGNDGDDNLNGGAGNDNLNGGAGIDTADYSSSSTYVTVDLQITTAQNTQGAGTDVLTGIENLTGTNYNDSLRGNSDNNVLIGLLGSDLLDGRGGADTMIGGGGSDTYYVDNAGDVVEETDANSTTGSSDIVYSQIANYTLSSNVENGVINTNSAANMTGNALNNSLHAGGGDNIIDGGDGSDTLYYSKSTAAVSVNLSLSGAQATGGSGNDTLMNIEHIVGSNYNDTLTGNAISNYLNGGSGNDVLDGGAGSDNLNGEPVMTP